MNRWDGCNVEKIWIAILISIIKQFIGEFSISKKKRLFSTWFVRNVYSNNSKLFYIKIGLCSLRSWLMTCVMNSQVCQSHIWYRWLFCKQLIWHSFLPFLSEKIVVEKINCSLTTLSVVRELSKTLFFKINQKSILIGYVCSEKQKIPLRYLSLVSKVINVKRVKIVLSLFCGTKYHLQSCPLH